MPLLLSLCSLMECFYSEPLPLHLPQFFASLSRPLPTVVLSNSLELDVSPFTWNVLSSSFSIDLFNLASWTYKEPINSSNKNLNKFLDSSIAVITRLNLEIKLLKIFTTIVWLVIWSSYDFLWLTIAIALKKILCWFISSMIKAKLMPKSFKFDDYYLCWVLKLSLHNCPYLVWGISCWNSWENPVMDCLLDEKQCFWIFLLVLL